jgi:hypothetical protein
LWEKKKKERKKNSGAVTNHKLNVRFEVFTAVTMKNGVFWDVMLCASSKDRRFGGT